MATNSEVRQDFLLQPHIDITGLITGIPNSVYYDFPLEDTISPSGQYLPTPYGDSDNQHKLDIIQYDLGSLKNFPLLGFGVLRYQKSEYNADNVSVNLTQQMKSDGYLVKSGCLSPDPNGGFIIDTDFISNNY